MGDRANIMLVMPKSYGPKAQSGRIYLYTHWSGHQFPEALREALEFGKGRWNDDQYLARIITSRVFRNLVDDTTGGGIGLTIGDNEPGRPVIVANLIDNTVSFADEGAEGHPARRYGRMTFAEYVGQIEATYPAVRARNHA
jgi:hypothetical protein